MLDEQPNHTERDAHEACEMRAEADDTTCCICVPHEGCTLITEGIL